MTDKELLAVRYFVEYYRQLLLGVTFRVRSDQQALVWIFSFREPKGRVCQWLEILSAYSFTVEYRLCQGVLIFGTAKNAVRKAC